MIKFGITITETDTSSESNVNQSLIDVLHTVERVARQVER